MKLPGISKKFWIVVSTVGVMALLFAYYLLIYVEDRKVDLIAKNYRMLKRTGMSILDLKNYYNETIVHYHNDWLKERRARERAKLEATVRRRFEKQGFVFRTDSSFSAKVSHTGVIYFSGIAGRKDVPTIAVPDFLSKATPKIARFDEFLLIRVFHCKSGEFPCDANDAHAMMDTSYFDIGYQSLGNRIHLKDIAQLTENDHGFGSIPVRDVKFSGETYKIFSSWIQFSPSEDWILCGAMKESAFSREIHRVDTYRIVFAMLILIFVLLAMPVLKLLVMNAIERLRIINVWFSGFSIVVGTSTVIIILMEGNQYLGYRDHVINNLDTLSKDIEKRFTGELDEIYRQMLAAKAANTGVNDVTVPVDNFFEPEIWKIVDPLHERQVLDLQNVLVYPFTVQTMWLNAAGEQKYVLATNTATTFNLSGRDYFKNAMSGKLWRVPDAASTDRKFSLQSIRSYTSGLPGAGISIPLDTANHRAAVLAMSTKLYSVIDAQMPPGYGFCIIDGRGEVWFHSDPGRNMQENFLEETDRNEQIEAAMTGRMAIDIEAVYDGKPHQLFIQPVNNVPLHLVTFYDLEYYKTPLVLTLGYSMALLVFMFLLVCLHLFLLYACVYKPTKLKIQRFYLNWIRPRRTENNLNGDVLPKPVALYTRSIATLVVLCVLSLVALLFPQYAAITFAFLVLPLYIFVFQYFLFERENILRPHQSVFRLLYHPFAVVSIILIVLVNVFMARYVDRMWIAVCMQALFALVMFAGYAGPLDGLSSTNLVTRHRRKLYVLMICSWVVAVSVLPVFAFYKAAYSEESVTWAKYLQWEAAQNEFNRMVKLGDELKVFEDSLGTLARRGDYMMTTGEFQRRDSLDKRFIKQAKAELHYLEFSSRPPLRGIIKTTRAMLEPSAEDEKWSWFDDTQAPTLGMKYTADDGKVWYYVFPKLHLDVSGSNYFLFFLVLTACFLYLIYRVIIFVVRNTFGLGIVSDTRFIQEAHRTIRNDDLAREHMKRIFIVGLPYAGKSLLLKTFKDASQQGPHAPANEQAEGVVEVNMRTDSLKPFVPYKARTVILKHFEHGINDHEINQRKLDWLQELVALNLQIIITSTVQPTAVLDFYERALQRVSSRDKDDRKEWTDYKHAVRMWKNILSDFAVCYQPLKQHDKKLNNPDVYIRAELEHGRFLPDLEHHIPFESTTTYADQENFVLKIEELADMYYHSLWNSFSNAEKFLLYDLAKDRYVNLKNINVIRILMQKGVVVAEDSLQIMNKSFNNFILSAVNEDDEIRMEKEQNQKGTWSLVHTVLIVLLLGIVAFIAIAQQELFKNINGLIGAIISAAALLTRVGGLFSPGSKSRDV